MNRQKLARSEKALNIVTYIILTIVVIFVRCLLFWWFPVLFQTAP